MIKKFKFKGIDWEEVSEEEYDKQSFSGEYGFFKRKGKYHYFIHKRKKCSKCKQVIK